jgi:hypothetical protein
MFNRLKLVARKPTTRATSSCALPGGKVVNISHPGLHRAHRKILGGVLGRFEFLEFNPLCAYRAVTKAKNRLKKRIPAEFVSRVLSARNPIPSFRQDFARFGAENKKMPPLM